MYSNFSDLWKKIRRGEYEVIGSGSGRRVYDLGNGYVAKVAKNIKGIAQNKTEYRIYLDNPSSILAKVYDVSDDYSILIAEFAKELPSLTYLLTYYKVDDVDELMKLREMRILLNQFNLIRVDLERYSSWGVVHGVPVIVDYGYNRRTMNRYY